MSKRWFVRQRNIFGDLIPIVYYEHLPGAKTATGAATRIEESYEIPEDVPHMTLAQYDAYFPPKTKDGQ